jgi:hypothetical protein
VVKRSLGHLGSFLYGQRSAHVEANAPPIRGFDGARPLAREDLLDAARASHMGRQEYFENVIGRLFLIDRHECVKGLLGNKTFW